MSSGDNLAEFPFGTSDPRKHWYLDLSASTYDEGLSFLRDDGQTQGQFNSDFNFSLEPDEALDLELEPIVCIAESAFTKRHTMPELCISPICPSSQLDGLPQLASSSPKRAETYPSTIEALNIARSKKLIIDDLLSKIDPGTSSTSSDSVNSEPSDTNNVAQSMQVNPITDLGCDEWPVPTFFLDQIEGPTPPGLDRADDLTPEDLENSPIPFGTIQPNDIEDNETNDYCSMAEDLDSVPPLNPAFVPRSGPHSKVTHSDSGIGSSTMSYRAGPQSIMGSSYKNALSRKGRKSSRGSHAKGSVMFDRESVVGSTTAGLYQQFAAKLGPLTSAASSTARSVETPRMLSETALKTMKTIILEPILNDSRFRDFWYICNMAGEQMESGQIGSLRDLEKFLLHKASNIKDNQAYNIFCKAFLNHVRESLKYMPQNELLRPYDRPYDTGYFLDTLAPFDKSTMQSTVLEVSQEEEQEFDPAFVKWLDYTTLKSEKRVAGADDEHENAAKRLKPNRLELIIPTNDTQSYLDGGYNDLSALSNDAIRDIITPMSRNTGLMGPPPLPQIHSRNKGRRRGPGQQAKEQQLFPCKWPACTHEPFRRACDLTKHEKTHTRPHKCSVVDCKYAVEGFPTEKERDRHWTDKHSPDTPSYHCQYPPCTYKSKRDSNCKQHMEKAHGYKYERMKQNYKTNGVKRQSVSPTSSTGQRSLSAGSPPSGQQSYATQPSAMTSQYQTTGFQPATNVVFSPSTQQYSRQDLEFLDDLGKRLLMANENQDTQFNYLTGGSQGHAHTSDNSDHQGYMQQNPAEQLPFPDAMDPSLLMYTQMPLMPDENIDPHLQQFMNNNMDGRINLSLGDTQELMPYSGLIT